MKTRCQADRSLRTASSRHSGRTLIELLIAMVLSLMIVAAVGTLYSVSSNSSRTAQQVGGAEERGRLAMYFLSEPIALAGFGNINSGSVTVSRFAAVPLQGPHLRACRNGRFQDPMNGDFTCVASPLPGDQLFVAFQAESLNGLAPQGAMTDCLGQGAVNINGVETIRNLYSIEQTAGGALELSCLGNPNSPRQGLIRDVENFKVYLAFDSFGHALSVGGSYNSTVRPSTLLRPDQVDLLPGAADDAASQGNPWNHVVAVYVCVQLRTSEMGTSADAASRFRPCPVDENEAVTGTAEVAANDGFARRTLTEVYTIRARAQAGAASKIQ